MRKDSSNDDVFDLSEMIDEYDEDNELRRKIEAMKKSQKDSETQETNHFYEQEEPQNYEAFTRSSYAAQSEGIEADNEAQSYSEADFDKTRVVMEHPRYDEEEAKEADDSVYLYDNHEVTEEEITEDDINEFLGEKKASSKKPSMDEDKMNKIITGVIIGIVSLCLIIGIGFGIKAMFFNSDETPVTDTDTNKDKDDNDKDDDEEKPIIDNPDDDEKDKPDDNDNPVTDNTKEIAEIKGKIEANTKQINSYNNQIKDAQKIVDKGAIDPNELVTVQNELKVVEDQIEVVKGELANYNTQCKNEGNDSEFCATFDANAKGEELNTLTQKQRTLNSKFTELTTQQGEFNKASAKITELNKEVTRLNNENKELQNKLSSLQ